MPSPDALCDGLRVVLDSNVWIDILVFDDPATRPIRAALETGAVTALIDARCLGELERVLDYPQFKARAVDKAAALATVARLTQHVAGPRANGGSCVAATADTGASVPNPDASAAQAIVADTQQQQPGAARTPGAPSGSALPSRTDAHVTPAACASPASGAGVPAANPLLARTDALPPPPGDAPPRPLPKCKDRDDQKFLELAYAARADWLVSKDRALLKLARRTERDFGFRIAPPESFAARALPAGAPEPA
ncbi:PIN domain-containing protein [Burkholderia singularis]|uniref:PIN domain-containing protein n=1 Tax=Burkholderia singularis TaxID=1503053 RepID=A0A103E7G0_9BURK|nr:PIN domain-containing protein [Burkholderia singularis]